MLMDHELSAQELALKRKFIAARGYWREWTDFLLRHDPKFLDFYARYGGHAAATGPLSQKIVELLYVALDASSTHLFGSGLVLHIRLALENGASVREILDVLRIATAQGLHGTLAGVAILAEELAAAGVDAGLEKPLSQAQEALRNSYVAQMGEWPAYCSYLVQHDPEFLALICEMNQFDGEGLDAQSRSCIEIALAACFTGYSEPALRSAIRRALRGGVEADAILQVLQMTAHLGVHSFSLGVPSLQEVLGSS